MHFRLLKLHERDSRWAFTQAHILECSLEIGKKSFFISCSAHRQQQECQIEKFCKRLLVENYLLRLPSRDVSSLWKCVSSGGVFEELSHLSETCEFKGKSFSGTWIEVVIVSNEGSLNIVHWRCLFLKSSPDNGDYVTWLENAAK